MILPNSTRSALALAGLLLGACAAPTPNLPEPLVKARAESQPGTLELIGAAPAAPEAAPPTTSLQATPKPPSAAKLSTLTPASTAPATKSDTTASITVAFDQMPLPNFVHAIYALILKKNYSMDPQVAARKDLVTLRASTLQTPVQIENAARLLLKTYGVAVSDLGAGNYRVTPDNTQTGYAPQILRGRALPEVPLALRPIYQLVEFQAVRSSEVAAWLTKIFGPKVSIIDDAPRNTLILGGQSDDVAAVLAAIEVLDQPLMKGRQSLRINPVFWSADDLAKKLVEILTAEGYSATASAVVGTAGQYPINLVPIAGINALIVFAADPAVMQHIADWAQDFDKPNPSRSAGGGGGGGGGYFTYKVRHTNADNLAKTMQSLLGDAHAAPPPQAMPTGAVVIGPPPVVSKSARVIVNAPTNTLIFQGGNANHTQLLTLLQELDQPARSALIEVTVAEVTLDDTTQLGVEWAFNAAGARYVGGTLSGVALGTGGLVTGGLGIGTGGLTIGRVNSAGDLRALINLLATNTRANVLSTPRVLARNGETATIQVGSSIPTISQQQTNAATGGSGVLQSVQYRDTGVILKVKPIIYAGDRIDLDISQEVSDSTKVGVANSPIIDTRRVQTQLSLKDGSPVLLGGLISQTTSRSESGIPLLKDIPYVGQLFRTNTDSTRKTELLVLITPYIITDDHDAQEITRAFRGQLGEWARPNPAQALNRPAPVAAPSTTTATPLPVNPPVPPSEPQ